MRITRQKRPDRVICKWGKFTVEVFENNKQKDFDLSESFTHGNNGGVKTSYLEMGDNSTAKVATNTPFTKPNNEYAKKLTKKQTKEMIDVIKNTPSPIKPNNEWEKEFEKETWHFNHKSGWGGTRGCNCEMEDKCKENLKDFISKTLQQQREEIIKEIEGIVGEDEKYDVGFYSTGCAETLIIQIRNQFRKEIRERLKQITNLKEK